VSSVINKIDKLKIMVFWEILKTGNAMLLDSGYFEDKEYTKEERFKIEGYWLEIYNQYYLLENDSKTKTTLSNANEEMLLLFKLNLLIENYNFLKWTYRHRDLIDERAFLEYQHRVFLLFEKIHDGFKLEYFSDFEINSKKIERLISSLTNTYNIKKKKTDVKIEEQVSNIYVLAQQVGEVFGFRLDVENMYVPEWLAWQKRAKEKSIKMKSNVKK